MGPSPWLELGSAGLRATWKQNMLRILGMLDAGAIHPINGPKTESPNNALTLMLGYHRIFGKFQIDFESTGRAFSVQNWFDRA